MIIRLQTLSMSPSSDMNPCVSLKDYKLCVTTSRVKIIIWIQSKPTIFAFWVSGNSIVMDVDNVAMVLLFNNLRLATQRSTKALYAVWEYTLGMMLEMSPC